MFISSNTIITTENGNVLADSNYEKTFTVNGFISPEKIVENKKTSFIKTELFPTLSIGDNTEILSGRLESANNKLFIKNNFYTRQSLKEGDFLFVPKITYNVESLFNRTTLWLYAKYITSGYYCLEKQTNKPTIIIKLNRFSKKEAVKLKKYENITYDLNNKMIVIQNEEIIKEFTINKQSLNLKVYGCDENLAKFFLHAMLIENNNKIICKYKTLAYDIFMYAYSKCNVIYKITEYKNDNKKEFCISEANNDEFLIVQKQLYVKITKILEGKELRGISIKNPENNLFCIGFLIIK